MTRQLHAPTAGGSATFVAPSTCTHCGACYGSVTGYGSFTCAPAFENQAMGFQLGGGEYICKHFYAGWDCASTPGFCTLRGDTNHPAAYSANYGDDPDKRRAARTSNLPCARHRTAWTGPFGRASRPR